MSSSEDMGTGWRGAFGSFMIMRPSIFKCDWSIISIWNGVVGIQQIMMKYWTCRKKVWGKSGKSAGKVWGKAQGKSWEGLGKVQRRSIKILGKVQGR